MRARQASFGKLALLGALAAAASSSVPAAEAATEAREEVFFTKLMADTVAVTAGKFLGEGSRVPSGIQAFGEPAIEGGLADLQKIRNKTGEVVGFGIQMEVWTPDENGRPKPEFPTTWTLVLPGRGTLFLYEIEDPTKLFAKVTEARAAPQPWTGRIDERTTTGPGPAGVGIIVGGTGEFEGRRGTFIETNQFTAILSGGTGGEAVKGVDAATGTVGSTTLTITYTN